jgi:hypothetical protein
MTAVFCSPCGQYRAGWLTPRRSTDDVILSRMSRTRNYAVIVLASLTLSAGAPSVRIPARLIAPATVPILLAYGAELPKLDIFVTNPTPVARRVLVEAFAFDEHQTLLNRYSLSESVRAGDSALVRTTMEPCHAGFTERTCSVAAVQVRARSEEVVRQPRSLPAWIRLASTNVTSSIEAFGKREAVASVVVTNDDSRDAHIFLRFRLYNTKGFQVAVCNNEARPIFSDTNLLVPSGTSTRLGCTSDAFRDVADVPTSVQVELLGWELRR